MDQILTEMKNWPWRYAHKDEDAGIELEKRIGEAARSDDRTITYSELKRGVTFQLGDRAYQINGFENYGFDSGLIGDFLGFICMKSYETAGFVASAVVVMKEDGSPGLPSKPFFEWMVKLGALQRTDGEKAVEFWIRELEKAHDFYTANNSVL